VHLGASLANGIKPVDALLIVKKAVPLGVHWWMVAVTLLLFGLVAALVYLKPVVDEHFFFSSNDPQFRQSKKIEERFPSQPEMILAVSSRDISSARYLSRIQRLTQQIKQIDAVSAVSCHSSATRSVS
jgi:predicted RND superfamily exporter protein